MSGPESLFWIEDVSKLKNFGQVKRIEDLLGKGTSDIVYCVRFLDTDRPRMGWVEIKRLREWPKREDTLIKLPHYTTDQAKFLKRWGRAGAGAFLLARIEDDYLLWGWKDAETIQTGLPKSRLLALTVARGQGTFPLRDVLREIARWPGETAPNRPPVRGKAIK